MTKEKKAPRGYQVNGELISSMRLWSSKTRGQLAAAAGISEQTLISAETDPGKYCDGRVVQGIAAHLGLKMAEILREPPPRPQEVCELGESFLELERVCGAADAAVLPVIRDLSVPDDQIEEAYRAMLWRSMSRRGFPLNRLQEMLKSPSVSARVASTVPEPDLTVSVGDDFEKLEFSYAKRRHVVTDPELLWDCSCGEASQAQASSSCKIHNDAGDLAPEIDRRFGDGHVAIRFRGMVFYWKGSSALWPPSVDAFSMYLDLRADGVLDARHERVLDLGSGTGFLGIAVTHGNPHVKALDLADWLLTPILYSVINWRLNAADRPDVDIAGRLGQFTNWEERHSKPYDLVVCNPPYLPLLKGYRHLGWESTVSGTDLLERLILSSESIGKNVFLQFSDLALPEASAAASAAGVELRPVGVGRWVPFRVPLAFAHPEYLELLRQQRGLSTRTDHIHRHWHRLQTYVLSS